MVTTLKNNIEYIQCIRNKIKDKFPMWNELKVIYEGQPNNNFIISFNYELYTIDFIKDRGDLELNIYYDSKLIDLHESVYLPLSKSGIKWPLTICIEIIDYYIDFLKDFFERKE